MSVAIKREFVFATYAKNKVDRTQDAVFVKEIVHHPDGRTKRQLRRVDNYVRPFYITKKEYRDHEEKKEFEYITKLDEYRATQVNMPAMAFRALNGFNPKGYVGLKDINESQFVYGSDVSTPSLIAADYAKRWPDTVSKNTLAIMDYEWS